MKLEDQVVSLELSKRLKELGVKHENLFWWQFGVNDDERRGKWYLVDEGEKYYGNHDCYPAFTVAELFSFINFDTE